jgi:tRNA(fMet)-specific endonuclease VapC
MGILLDSTYFIAAERLGKSVKEALYLLEIKFPDEATAISVVTLMELAHGVERADTRARAELRERFLNQVSSALDVYPVSPAIALQAGRLSGTLMRTGIQIATADLLIAVTALDLRFKIVTANVRHFSRIPDLQIQQI